MRIIEIAALPNGAHRNQTGEFCAVPSGWAVVPSSLNTENFPFGEVTVGTVDGIPTVTEWAPGVSPEPALTPEEQREEAYNTLEVIEWDGEKLTVTQAGQLWQYYAAEGSTKAEELTVLIAEAKAAIRAQYPDPEVGA